MNALKAVELMKKYSSCPSCGNNKIGNGAGTLIVEDTTFTRTCKCGFEITLNENGEKNCATCDYWIEKYQECEHPEQRQGESGAYMSPPDKYCSLWEPCC